MTDPEHLFWDSCVIIRYVTRSPSELLGDLDDYVESAKRGDRKIYCSTLAMTEIRPRYFIGGKFGSIRQFFIDMESAFYPVEPNPNILIAAGELRDAEPVNPSDDNAANVRTIGTPDAIHLMTCLYIRDSLEVRDIVFHTFDEGKGKTWEGKCVPLLGFERWFPAEVRTERVKEVCGLPRTKPIYPQGNLLREVTDASHPISDQRH